MAAQKMFGIGVLFGTLCMTGVTARADSVTDSIPPILPADHTVKVETIASGMVAPNLGVSAPGLRRFLFVVDQTGQLWRIDLANSGAPVLFLDVSSLLVPLGIASLGGYDERGFLVMSGKSIFLIRLDMPPASYRC